MRVPLIIEHRENVKPELMLHVGLCIALAFTAPACASGKKTGKHLFILSGQSNMTGAVRDAFAECVHERYGEKNAVIVMRMKSGLSNPELGHA